MNFKERKSYRKYKVKNKRPNKVILRGIYPTMLQIKFRYDDQNFIDRRKTPVRWIDAQVLSLIER